MKGGNFSKSFNNLNIIQFPCNVIIFTKVKYQLVAQHFFIIKLILLIYFNPYIFLC
jgi:hypothetical protein